MEFKVCNKCNTKKETNDQNFYKAKKSKDGYMGICKDCKFIYDKLYVSKNKEKVNAWKNNYRMDNKEKLKEKSKLYKDKNKEKISLYNKLYLSNPKNKDRKNDLKRLMYVKPSQEKRYELSLKDKQSCKIRTQRYRAVKRQLLSNFTNKEWQNCKSYFKNKCAYCGCDCNLHQDHFIPLSKGGEYTKGNIIPSCKKCNSSKKDSEFIVWYVKQPYYNKEKEDKIIEYLRFLQS